MLQAFVCVLLAHGKDVPEIMHYHQLRCAILTTQCCMLSPLPSVRGQIVRPGVAIRGVERSVIGVRPVVLTQGVPASVLQLVCWHAVCPRREPTRVHCAGKPPLFVSFAGGGLYFFWQLGAVKFLREHYDITNVPMAGASSGSLIACLAACGVDPEVTLEAAHALSLKADIWNRKLGVIGIWGKLIRGWLDDLLPDDAHLMVSGRLHVIIAKAPTLNLFEARLCTLPLPLSATSPSGQWAGLSPMQAVLRPRCLTPFVRVQHPVAVQMHRSCRPFYALVACVQYPVAGQI